MLIIFLLLPVDLISHSPVALIVQYHLTLTPSPSQLPRGEFFFFFFFSFIYISRRLITLQYCSGVCHTLIRINFLYSPTLTCIHDDWKSHRLN